jgi:ABC-2 type transport system permease protein
LAGTGIGADRAREYLKSIEMKLFQIQAGGETRSSNQTVILGLLMFFSIFLTIFLYGHSVMQGVIEEKQSRIVELMLSSVKPFSMMIGKIIGIGLVGLTQYCIWVLSILALSSFGFSLVGRSPLQLNLFTGWILLYFVIYFILGYFLFATLFAIIGSIVSRPEDAQQLHYPVSILLAAPGVMFWMIIRDPNGTPQVVLSLVPFFSPTFMMLRMAAIEPPLWQILLSMVLMIATTLAGMWVAAKVHRVGILMTGKRPSIVEVGRWLRYR